MSPSALEKFCMGLKGTTQDVKWGADLCFCIGSKMYCVTSLEGPPKTSFKVTAEDFGDLIERDGIIPAPYMAKHHWVLIENPRSLSIQEWQIFVKGSYQMVFDKLTKKAQQLISKA